MASIASQSPSVILKDNVSSILDKATNAGGGLLRLTQLGFPGFFLLPENGFGFNLSDNCYAMESEPRERPILPMKIERRQVVKFCRFESKHQRSNKFKTLKQTRGFNFQDIK